MNSHKSFGQSFALGSALISLVFSEAAIAQDASVPASSTSSENVQDGIADIVVTAQRQVSSVQRTPLAITAVSGDTLSGRGTVNVEALTRSIPNISFGRTGSDARVFIRGVGLDSAIGGVDGRVAIYTDEVVNARPQAALGSLYDLQRIEVLRGPQGTLYGRNATAGAINIISNDPTDTLEGYGTLTVGNYSLIRTEGAISGPLSDTVSARLAFQTNDHSGYGKNIQTGEEVNDERNRALRAKLLIKPSETFKLMLQADYRWQRDHQGGLSYLGEADGRVPVDIALGFVPPTDPQDRSGHGPHMFQEGYGISATATLNLGGAQITSITAYKHLEQLNDYSLDNTTADHSYKYDTNRAKQFSQELRLSADLGMVNLLVGGFYFHEKNFYGQRAALWAGYFGIPGDTILEGTAQGGTQKTDAYAAFAQATINFTDKLGVDIGGRYSYEKRHIDEFFQLDLSRPFDLDNPPLPGFISPGAFRNTRSQSASWSSFDPKVALHYQITNDVLAYLSYSRGFKSGGFNFGGLQAPFKPEKLTDYEGGIKADLFNRKLRVNLAGFYYEYKNLQVNVIEGLALVTRNAAKARVYGAEAEITALPIDDLRMKFNFAWLHSEYRNYDDINPVTGLREDLTGNQLTYAPKYKVVGEIGYTLHPSFGDLTPRAELSWTDKTYYSQFNVPYQIQPARWELNLYLDLVRNDGWSASAYMRNVTDNEYIHTEILGPAVFGLPVLGNRAAPRTFGVAITKKF
ncbi:TonB-dependent receptor [Sphingobium ummariense]